MKTVCNSNLNCATLFEHNNENFVVELDRNDIPNLEMEYAEISKKLNVHKCNCFMDCNSENLVFSENFTLKGSIMGYDYPTEVSRMHTMLNFIMTN